MLRVPTEIVNQVFDEQFLPEGEAISVDAVVTTCRKRAHEAPEPFFVQVFC